MCACVHLLYYTTPVFAADQPGLKTHARSGFGSRSVHVVFIFILHYQPYLLVPAAGKLSLDTCAAKETEPPWY